MSQDLSKSLIICNEDSTCSCPVPKIATVENFVLPPGRISKDLASCEHSLLDINKILSCVNFGFPIATTLPKCRSDIIKPEDCNGFQLKSMPDTYKPSQILPKNCGYRWKGFSVRSFRSLVKAWKDEDKVKCSPSMCTSATFLALISQAKTKYKNGEINKEEFDRISEVGGDAYKILNSAAEPNELVETFNLGTGHYFDLSNTDIDEKDVPSQGDIVQIWRKNDTGHSVVFKGLIDMDNDGKSDKLCYWSSQRKTNGYGNVCEDINDMSRLLIGHFE